MVSECVWGLWGIGNSSCGRNGKGEDSVMEGRKEDLLVVCLFVGGRGM